MKVIAKTSENVLVEMSPAEFQHCFDAGVSHTGEPYRGIENIEVGREVKVLGLSRHLIDLRSQKPNLKQLRGVMQAFLALTEPDAIEKTLKESGVPVPVFVPLDVAADQDEEF